MFQYLHGTGGGGGSATILYLHGFASGPDSVKGRALEERFAELGVSFRCIDLTPGAEGFENSTPITMLVEAERQVAAARPRVLIGSSLGGYLAALVAARQREHRRAPVGACPRTRKRLFAEEAGAPGGAVTVERVVLLAPAFRFYERWRARVTPEEEERWRREGLEVQHHATGRPRRLAWAFMADAAKLPAYPEVRLPSLCLTGRRDETVPLEDVERFAAATQGSKLVVLDDGHDLVASIGEIFQEAREFLRPITGV